MSKSIRSSLLVLSLIAMPLPSLAHKFWLLPSATVLSSDQWIVVDAAVSNDLFYFNHAPGRLDNLQIIAPDGSALEPENPQRGHLRSSFDLHLSQDGTYRIALAGDGLFASWEEQGKPKRWRGDAASFATEVPAKAAKLKVSQTSSRTETFATAGAPNNTVFKTTGHGLEFKPITHPNDLYSGETAQFGFLIDGKPATGLSVSVVPGGIRYRDQQNEIELTTDKKGRIELNWPAPGMYWLNVSAEDDKATFKQASQRRLSYSASLEVLPQ